MYPDQRPKIAALNILLNLCHLHVKVPPNW